MLTPCLELLDEPRVRAHVAATDRDKSERFGDLQAEKRAAMTFEPSQRSELTVVMGDVLMAVDRREGEKSDQGECRLLCHDLRYARIIVVLLLIPAAQ